MDAVNVDGSFCDAYPKIVRRKGRTFLYLAHNVVVLLPPTHSPLAIAWFKDRLTPEQRQAYAIARYREIPSPDPSDTAHLLAALAERPL